MCGLIRLTHFSTIQDTVTNGCLRNHKRVHYPSKFQPKPIDGIHGSMVQDLILDHDWLRLCETRGDMFDTIYLGTKNLGSIYEKSKNADLYPVLCLNGCMCSLHRSVKPDLTAIFFCMAILWVSYYDIVSANQRACRYYFPITTTSLSPPMLIFGRKWSNRHKSLFKANLTRFLGMGPLRHNRTLVSPLLSPLVTCSIPHGQASRWDPLFKSTVSLIYCGGPP